MGGQSCIWPLFDRKGNSGDLMMGMDDFLSAQYEACPRKLSVSGFLEGRLSYDEWRAGIRAKLDELLGSFPGGTSPAVARDAGQAETLDFGTRRQIIIPTGAGLDTPAYILTPHDITDRTPIILCLHGHGYGSADIVCLLPEVSYQKNFAMEVCRQGMIAVAPELVGFGSLRLQEDILGKKADESSCHRLSMGLISCGRTMAGLRVHQCRETLNVLEALYPGHPIGVMGISGGGMVATMLSVLDERVSACVISGYASTFRGSILAMFHCVDNYLPGMLNWFELTDLLSAVAPRPMLWEAGSRDPIFPRESVLEAGESVRACYNKMKAGASFHIDAFEGEHEISGAESYLFLKAHSV
jgi:dienelactone hydrolase